MADSQRQELDLNIQNWSIDDLYELFDIPKGSDTNKVASIADNIIQKQTASTSPKTIKHRPINLKNVFGRAGGNPILDFWVCF